MPINKENDATAGIQTITRSSLCLRVIGNIVTSSEKDDWLQQTGLWIATAENGLIWRYFLIFPLQEMLGICCHASVFLIRPTPTHNNTLQVILKISIFGLWTLPLVPVFLCKRGLIFTCHVIGHYFLLYNVVLSSNFHWKFHITYWSLGDVS